MHMGFSGADDVPAAQAWVFRYDWARRQAPAPEELARALAERSSHAIRSAAQKLPDGSERP